MTGIYGIKNKDTGKWYIGQAVDIKERWSRHLLKLRKGQHHSSKLQSSFNKHGEAAFCFVVLEECMKEELKQKEMLYIEKYNSYENGYNMTLGGEGTLNRVCTETTRRKISEAVRGEKHPFYGKKRSDGFRKKIIASNTGRVCSDETRQKMREKNTGYKHTEESRRKMSIAQKGRKHSEETKRKISEANKGCNNHNYGKPLSSERKRELLRAANEARRKKVICVETGTVFNSAREAAEATGTNYSNLCSCCNGRVKRAGGFHWEFVREVI